MAVRDHPSTLGSDHADNDADAIFLAGERVDAIGDDLVDIIIGRKNGRARALNRLSSGRDDYPGDEGNHPNSARVTSRYRHHYAIFRSAARFGESAQVDLPERTHYEIRKWRN